MFKGVSLCIPAMGMLYFGPKMEILIFNTHL
jgi:hypothetical protein